METKRVEIEVIGKRISGSFFKTPVISYKHIGGSCSGYGELPMSYPQWFDTAVGQVLWLTLYPHEDGLWYPYKPYVPAPEQKPSLAGNIVLAVLLFAFIVFIGVMIYASI